MERSEKVAAFLKAVEEKGLSEDLSKAARHHSAANVTEGDAVLKKLQESRK